jgi:hypothetical protein
METLKVESKGLSSDKRNTWRSSNEDPITEITIHKGEVLIMHYKNGAVEKVIDAILLSKNPEIIITSEIN